MSILHICNSLPRNLMHGSLSLRNGVKNTNLFLLVPPPLCYSFPLYARDMALQPRYQKLRDIDRKVQKTINPFFKAPSFEKVNSHSLPLLYSQLEKELPELTFEEFKKQQMEDFKTFLKNPHVEALFKNASQERLLRAYESHCRTEYSEYKQARKGGNAALML